MPLLWILIAADSYRFPQKKEPINPKNETFLPFVSLALYNANQNFSFRRSDICLRVHVFVAAFGMKSTRS